MKNTKSKFAVLLLVLFALFTLSACGGQATTPFNENGVTLESEKVRSTKMNGTVSVKATCTVRNDTEYTVKSVEVEVTYYSDFEKKNRVGGGTLYCSDLAPHATSAELTDDFSFSDSSDGYDSETGYASFRITKIVQQ